MPPSFILSNLISPLLTNSFFQDICQKGMAANSLHLESTSSYPQFQALYITLIPYPGARESLFLKRTNISKFLKKVENMCDDCQMSALKKIRRIPRYCEILTTQYIRSVFGFFRLDWTKICVNSKKKYRD